MATAYTTSIVMNGNTQDESSLGFLTSTDSLITWSDLNGNGSQQIRNYNGGVTIHQGNTDWGLTTTSGTNTVWGGNVTLGNFDISNESEDLKEFISFLKKYFDKLPFTYEEFMEMSETEKKRAQNFPII